MRVLISNDDGIDAGGIRALIDALKEDYDLYVCAPMHERSGSSHCVTYYVKDNQAERRTIDGVKEAWAVEGTPADCVYYGIYAMGAVHPDLVVTGINHGENLSMDILYSGTLGAASEAQIAGIPAIAFSYCSYTDQNYETAAKIAKDVVNHFRCMEQKDMTLSVNIPPIPYEKIKGYKVTVPQSGRNYQKKIVKQNEDGNSFVLHTLSTKPFNDGEGEENGDVRAIEAGYVSLTPLANFGVREDCFNELSSFEKIGGFK